MRGHGKRTATFKPRGEASGDTRLRTPGAHPPASRAERYNCVLEGLRTPAHSLSVLPAPALSPPWWLPPRGDRPGSVLPGLSLSFFRPLLAESPAAGWGRLLLGSLSDPPHKALQPEPGRSGPAPRTAPRWTPPCPGSRLLSPGASPSSSCTLCAGAGSQGAQCCHRAPHPASRAHGSALLALRQGPWGEPSRQAWCWHLCPGGSSGLGSPAGPGLTAGGAGRESCPQRRPLLRSPPPGP